MRSAPSLLAAGLAVLTSTGAVAKDGQIVSVLELRSHVREDVDAGRLTDRVREVARGVLPDARILPAQELFVLSDTCADDCDLAAARDQGADLVASGEVTSGNPGFRVSLILRQVRSGQVVTRASAASNSLVDLTEAVAAASADLFHGVGRSAPPAVVSVDAPALPELPALPSVPEGGAVNLSVDANVLVAYDRARNIELKGKEKPDEAAYAWEAVANADGENPYRAVAADRARQWRAYADNKHAFESQLARDTARLRKVLPLGSVTETVKLELLTRYAKAYGSTRASTMLPYIPMGLIRDRAALVVGCESNDPGKCLALSRLAQETRDEKAAAEYLDRACAAGAFAACTDAAARIRPTDGARATAALQKGCAGNDGKSCAQLAKAYEDGSAGKIDAAVAAGYREKACSAGDGKSCRKLAAALDSGDDAADQKRAAELWRKGCIGGDATSCTFARMSVPPVRNAVQEATYGARPASTVPPTASPASATPAAPAPALKQQLENKPSASVDNGPPSTAGAILIGTGVLAAGGALFWAANDPSYGHGSSNRGHLTTQSNSSRLNLVPALGLTALLSTATGIGLIMHAQHERAKATDIQVGVAPTGLVLSGKLP